jgi:hypothetical protein
LAEGRAVSVTNILTRKKARLRVLVIAVLGVAAAFLGFVTGGHASAHEPHAGLEFHLGVDTNGDSVDDCSTVGDAPGFCAVPIGTMFTVNAYLDSSGLAGYDGMQVYLGFTGVVAKSDPNGHVWPDCVFQGSIHTATYSAEACAIGIGAPLSTYVGKVATAAFTCAADGTIALQHGTPFTNLTNNSGADYHAEAGPDALNIRCFAPSLGGVAEYPNVESGSSPGLLASVLAGVVAVLLVSGAFVMRRRAVSR